MARIPIGDRIRTERKRRGMSQGELARRLSVSPGYLSLIENDKRQIGGALLKRIAAILEVDPRALSATNEGRLAKDLGELARALALPGLDEKAAATLVGLSPAWGHAFVRLYRELQDTRAQVEALGERLSRDPEVLSLTHRIFTQITAIRSFAEILSDCDNLSAGERKRFADIIAAQAGELSASAKDMMGCLETTPEAPVTVSPAHEVDDFLMDHGNYFAAIEEAAERLLPQLLASGLPLEVAIAARLEEDHGVRVLRADGAAPAACAAGRRDLVLPPAMPPATVRFRLARELAARAFARTVERVLAGSRLSSEEARARARSALARYGAGCLVLPYDRVLEEAGRTRYDIDAMAARLGASFEQIAHRLVTLRRPDAEGIPFAFLRTDPAGNISKRFSSHEIRMPHVTGACPLWIVYAAFQTPGITRTQMVEMPDGERFLFIARKVTKAPTGYGRPPVQFSVMLGCDSAHAGRTVYGDAFAAGHDSLVIPAGYDCRSCGRPTCEQRAFPPALTPAAAGEPTPASAGPDAAAGAGAPAFAG